MTLAHITPTPAVPALPEQVDGRRVTLADELQLWRETAEFASHIANTPFVPEAIRNNPGAVAVAMLRSNELGVSPLEGLSQIHIIKGRPCLSSQLMRALIQRAGHELWTEELTQTTVTLCGRRRGEDHVQKVTWTLDDAKRAGLTGNQSWRSYPQAMLIARATGALARLAFADVIAGIPYTVEEVEDGFDELPAGPPADAAGAVPAPKREKRRAARTGATSKTAPAVGSGAPAGQPPLPGEDGYDTVVDTAAAERPSVADAEIIARRAQQIAVMAKNAGVDHHHVVAVVTHGRAESAKDLTEPEASHAVELLRAVADGRTRIEPDDEVGWRVVDVEAGDAPAGESFDWSAQQWTEFGAAHGVKPGAVLVFARQVAAQLDVDQPTSLEQLAGQDALCEALRSTIEEAGSGG